jgi:hypothetical protein
VPLTSQNFICNEKEKRYKRNIMFLFAGHSDKPLKSLISIAHKENNICLYRFSFIYVVCPAKLDHTSRCKSGHGNRQ